MANLAVKDGAAADKYLKTSGAGTDVDPHVPEHLETNSAAILAAVDGVEALLTTIDADTSELAAAIDGEMQVDVVSSALPTGAATAALQTTLNGYVDGIETLLGTIDGDTSTLAVVGGGAEATALRVTLANDSTGVISVDDNGGALTVDGTVAVTHAALTELGAAIDTEVQVDVVGALPAGDNNIGNVDIASALPAGTNNIGDVDVASLPSANVGQKAMAASLSVVPASDVADGTYIGDIKFGEGLPASSEVIGLVGASDIVVTITPTLDTNAYTGGDLLFDSTEIANAVRVNGGTCIVQSITIIDKDDQLKPMKLIFADAATDFGTVNSAPDPDDTEVATVVGHYEVSIDDSANNIDLGGASVHCHRNVGLVLKAGAATTSLWVAGMTMGAPTHTASGLVIKLGILRS